MYASHYAGALGFTPEQVRACQAKGMMPDPRPGAAPDACVSREQTWALVEEKKQADAAACKAQPGMVWDGYRCLTQEASSKRSTQDAINTVALVTGAAGGAYFGYRAGNILGGVGGLIVGSSATAFIGSKISGQDAGGWNYIGAAIGMLVGVPILAAGVFFKRI